MGFGGREWKARGPGALPGTSWFEQGVAWAAAPGAKEWCPIGPDGRPVAALECRRTYYPLTITHSYPEQFSADPYENTVLWTRAWLHYLAGEREHPPKWKPGSPAISIGEVRQTATGKTVLIATATAVPLLIAGAYRRSRQH